MALTEQQQKAREGKLNASDVACLVNGDNEEKYNLWLQMTGDPSWKPRERTWPMMLGEATEQAHLNWLERELGTITQRGTRLISPEIEWAACTLDGWIDANNCPAEVKHNNGFETIDVIFDRYMPQMHWIMFCAERKDICFSVIRGTKEPEPFFLGLEPGYLVQLIAAAEEFMACVRELREPCPNPTIKAPKPPAIRRVDMSQSNSWSDYAGTWLRTRSVHQLYETAAKEIKKLCPDDAKEIFGHGITVKRNKKGSLTIQPEGETNGKDESNNNQSASASKD